MRRPSRLARSPPTTARPPTPGSASAVSAPGFVALAPGSIWGTKRWPGYAELAAALDAPVVVLGSPDDAPLAEQVVAAAPGRAHSAAGTLGLRTSAALIARAGVLVTNDSAPLHLATAVGTPVVAIFGPTVPAFGFGPRGPRDVVVEHPDARLPPLLARTGPQVCPLGHHRCMRELSVAVRRSRRWRPCRAWRRIVRFVLGIDIGGTNLVVGSVAEDGSAVLATASEPTHSEAGATDVVDRLVELARAHHRRHPAARRPAPRSSAWASARPARSTPGAASSCSRRTSAG